MRQRQLIMISLLVLVGLLYSPTAVKGQTATQDGLLATVTTASDSARAVVARAILLRDSVLLNSVLFDDVSVVMPDRKTHRGKAEVLKHISTLFEEVGGWKLTTFRKSLDLVQNMDGLAREAGRYELVEPVEKSKAHKRAGRYLAFWRVHNGRWVVQNLLLFEG